MKVKLMLGDCLDKMKKIPDNFVDSIVTDPPAGIKFMGKDWDSDKGGRDNWIGWMKDIFTEAKRTLKPGGHCFVWALPRTSHWTATALEDAGFEIRDIVTHVFGSGFPKSHNISKAIDKMKGFEGKVIGKINPYKDGKIRNVPIGFTKNYIGGGEGSETLNYGLREIKQLSDEAKQWEGWGTALKPASEHWILCRKPLTEKTIADNVLKWGVGGINIDKSRIEFENEKDKESAKPGSLNATGENSLFGLKSGNEQNDRGRFPSNLIHDGSDEVMEEFDKAGIHSAGKKRQAVELFTKDKSLFNIGREGGASPRYGDEGSAARFFYCSKASGKANNELQGMAGTERNGVYVNDQGRFPANFIHDGSDEVMEEFDKAGNRKSTKFIAKDTGYGKSNTYINYKEGGSLTDVDGGYTDEGSAARFFYCSKASGKEKNEGLEDFESKKDTGIGSTYAANQETSKIGGNPNKPTKPSKCTHPTVKPIKLMSYLINMITPPNGIVLDPFMGSGSTGVAAVKNGFSFIGIEKEPEYMEIAKARIEYKKKK